MLLRRSGDIREESYNLGAITEATDGEVGVSNEKILLEIAEAVYHSDDAALADLNKRGVKALGEQAFVDAIAVASGFHGITKVANATGIPLDDRTEEVTGELRQFTKIDDYADDVKSEQFG